MLAGRKQKELCYVYGPACLDLRCLLPALKSTLTEKLNTADIQKFASVYWSTHTSCMSTSCHSMDYMKKIKFRKGFEWRINRGMADRQASGLYLATQWLMNRQT